MFPFLKISAILKRLLQNEINLQQDIDKALLILCPSIFDIIKYIFIRNSFSNMILIIEHFCNFCIDKFYK